MKIAIISAILLGLITAYSFTPCSKKTTIITSDKEEGIHFFNGTWNEALIKAKKENKTIFLDAYTSWCGPCKQLKNKTFKNKSVAEYYNKHFINVSIDVETGEGPMLAQKYSVTAYPTLIFINREGSVISKSLGFHESKDFLDLGKKIVQSEKIELK